MGRSGRTGKQPATVDLIKPPTLPQVLRVIVPAGSPQGKRNRRVLFGLSEGERLAHIAAQEAGASRGGDGVHHLLQRLQVIAGVIGMGII